MRRHLSQYLCDSEPDDSDINIEQSIMIILTREKEGSTTVVDMIQITSNTTNTTNLTSKGYYLSWIINFGSLATPPVQPI